MKTKLILVAMCVMAAVNIVLADFASDIGLEFVTIGNAGNPGDTRGGGLANPYGCGSVAYEYQIGKYEVTNTQWDAFVSAAGAPTGNLSGAYDADPYWTGTDVPTNNLSWLEAIQFCEDRSA